MQRQLIQDMERAMQVLHRAKVAPEICYDSESSGLDTLRNHIVGHVLTFGPDPKDSFYLPVRHQGGGNIPGCYVPDTDTGWDGSDHPVEVELRSLGQRKWLGHNIKFDNRMLHRHRITLEGDFEDTGINGALIDEHEKSFSLDALATAYGVQAKKGEELYAYIAKTFPQHYKPKSGPDRKAMGHYWRTNASEFIVWDYAVGDGTSTWQLRDAQMNHLAEQDLLRVWKVESKLIPILTRMENKGILIDQERMAEVEKIIVQGLEETMNSFPSGFNVRGADVLKYVLDSGVDIDKVPRTKPSKRFPSGQPSVDEKFLKTIPAGQKIIRARQLGNLLNTFLGPLRDRHMFEGRVHTSFNQLRGDEYGTITGRLSSSEPNLQQIPKRNKELGPLFRSIFIPEPGMIWGSVDFSQCEPRLLAFYARVRVLLAGYRAAETVDAHTAVASAARIDRDSGKRLNQALLTGAGDAKIAWMLDKPNAEEMVEQYFAAMPEIKPMQKRATAAMRQRGYMVSLLGRRSRLKGDKAYVGLNRLLQCGNADILKQKMVECDEYLESEGRPIDILMNCHDANDFQYPPDERKHYMKCLEIMADYGPGAAIEIDLPMEVDSGEGANWSEATYGKNKIVVRGKYCEPGMTAQQIQFRAAKEAKEAARAAG